MLKVIHTTTLQDQSEDNTITDEVKNMTDNGLKAIDEKCYKKMQRCLQITGELISPNASALDMEI